MRLAMMPWFSGYRPVTIVIWLGKVLLGKDGISASAFDPPSINSSKLGVFVLLK